jgi:GH25 family lysozyme M1 (1,4-beta-N-acetylmuramidase)
LFSLADAGSFGWTNLQFSVTAGASNSLLEFQFRNDKNAFALDDIRLQAAPDLVFGLDCSSAEQSDAINWGAVASSQVSFDSQTYPVSFALIRASKGNADVDNCRFRDPYFASRAAAAMAAGLAVGAYHVAAITNEATGEFYSPASEAEFFLSVAGEWISQGNLRPLLSVEDALSGRGCSSNGLNYTDLSAWVDQWMQAVQQQTGVAPILYCNPCVAANLVSLAAKYQLCIAKPGADPATDPQTDPWETALIQYNTQGSLPGIASPVDLDVFQGTTQLFQSQLVITNTPAPQVASVTVVANPPVGGIVSGGGTYLIGSQQEISATATNGWLFAGWNDGSNDNPRAITVTASGGSYTATFVQPAMLTVLANPTDAGAVTGSGTFAVGSQQQISATATNGWLFAGWSDGSREDPHTVTVPAGGATFTAYFLELATLAVNGNPINGGTVNGGGTFPVGFEQPISATPKDGWIFAGWSDGTTDNPRTVTVLSGVVTYTAMFVQTGTIIVVASPQIGGFVSGGGAFPVGSQQQILATATNGWAFAVWNDGSNDNPRTFPVTASGATYTATFIQTAAIIVAASPSAGGSVGGNGTFPVGSQQQISATATNGWSFASWSDGSTDNPRTVTVVSGGAFYTAAFQLLVQPPALQAALSDILLTITITGTAGVDYTIQGSTDLVSWTDVQTVTLAPTGSTQAPIRTSDAPFKFFRVIHEE